MNQSPRYCTQCGYSLSPTARFCQKCGARVVFRAQVPAPTETAVPHQPSAQNTPTPRAQFAPQIPAGPPPPRVIPAPPPPSRKRSMVWIIGGIVLGAGLLCVCCLLVGIFWFYPTYVKTATSTPMATLATPKGGLETAPVPAPIDTITLPTQQPTESLLPTETLPSPAEPLVSVDFSGVTFSYDPSLAVEVVPELALPQTDPNAPIWDIAPSHSVFNFQGYPLYPDAFHEPRIYVYPAQEYYALNEVAANTINDLRGVLNRRVTDLPQSDTLPFLPIWNAAQMMQSNIEYLDFQNGSGVRFISMYGQAAYPVGNENLFYTFQGLTDDGRFYISAVLPVSNAVLPDPASVTLDDNFYNNFTNYMQDMENLLSAQPNGSFTPDLSLLDAMMATFRAE